MEAVWGIAAEGLGDLKHWSNKLKYSGTEYEVTCVWLRISAIRWEP